MCRGWEETTFHGTSTCSHTGEGMLLIVSLSPKTFRVTASYNLSPRVCGQGGEVGMTAGENSTGQNPRNH